MATAQSGSTLPTSGGTGGVATSRGYAYPYSAGLLREPTERDLAVPPCSRWGTAAAIFRAVTGRINAPGVSSGISALVTALIVERVPNAPEEG